MHIYMYMYMYMYVHKRSLHLVMGCYSVGAVRLSLENCAVNSAIVILSVLLLYMYTCTLHLEGNADSRLTAIFPQGPRGWAEFKQHLDSAQEELLNDMSISHTVATKTYSRPLYAFLYIFP